MRFEITVGGSACQTDAVRVTPVSLPGQTELYEIMASDAVKTVRIAFRMPMRDHVSVWHPTCGRDRGLPQWFHPQKTDACFYRGAPVLAALRADGTVYCMVSLSDTDRESVLGYYVDDFYGKDEVVFFIELSALQQGERVRLRIDTSPVPLPEALGRIWRAWNETRAQLAGLPDAAFEPLYSTWYSFHQCPRQEILRRELALAAEAGFGTVILDDGWQIAGEGTKDYRKSGDWMPAPDKFPDFKGFVRDVHAFGQKLILWFAVPFAGFETEAYRRFRDRLLFEEAGFIYAGTLDVRYKEVRDFLTGTYTRFIDEYDIDGLKLDFIDHFASRSAPPWNDKMDVKTVTEGVQTLLSEVCAAACARKPDFLFEYRQFYVGPGVMRCANLLRVCDCAFDAVTNRIGAVDLRMLTRDVAVHSDMLLWSPAESIPNCALQLANILFAVPQISVRLTEVLPEQLALLRAHLAYRRQNGALLTRGELSVSHPETGYSAVTAKDEVAGRAITVLYAQSARTWTGFNEDLWNATPEETVAVLNPSQTQLRLTVYNCLGRELQSFAASDAALAVNVPVGGYVNIVKMND